MAQHGFPVPPFCAYHEERRLGFVARAILVTATWPGSRLDHLATALAAGRRDLLGRELGRFVALLHATGFRDGNLDPRNVLAAEVGDRFALAKIDSPRFRVVAPGTRGDRLTRADWARLLPQLRALGLADATLAAARAAGADA